MDTDFVIDKTDEYFMDIEIIWKKATPSLCVSNLHYRYCDIYVNMNYEKNANCEVKHLLYKIILF